MYMHWPWVRRHVIKMAMERKFEVHCLWTEAESRQKPSDVNKLPDVDELHKMRPKPLHLETPLIVSRKLSKKLQANVWLKLDNLQPSQSFKLRGLGFMCQKVKKRGIIRAPNCRPCVEIPGVFSSLILIFHLSTLSFPVVSN